MSMNLAHLRQTEVINLDKSIDDSLERESVKDSTKENQSKIQKLNSKKGKRRARDMTVSASLRHQKAALERKRREIERTYEVQKSNHYYKKGHSKTFKKPGSSYLDKRK